MTTIFLALGIVVFFVIGLISPYWAGKIERKTDNKASWLKRMANWLWDPITWWAKLSIESSRKVIKNMTGWGRKIHKRLPAKDPGTTKRDDSTKS